MISLLEMKGKMMYNEEKRQGNRKCTSEIVNNT